MKKIAKRILYVVMLCIIPAIVSAQRNPMQKKSFPIPRNPVPKPWMDTMTIKTVEGSIPKIPCSITCPEGKTCVDGCCIYPLNRKAEGEWNYIIYNDCNPMKDLKLSFKVTKELEAQYDVAANCAQSPTATDQKLSSTEGVVVQFNCFSKDANKVKNTGGMIQYIFYVQGKSIFPHIQYVSGTPDGVSHDWSQIGITFPGLTLPKDNAIPEGYTLEVELGTGEKGYVNEVTFRVIDDKGKTYEKKAPKKNGNPPGATASHPETLYPVRITEFQTNVVSTNGHYVHFKKGGEGTLTYSSTDKLCVEGGSYDHCVRSFTGTCESSNAIYGSLSSCCTNSGGSFSQSVKINK